jgi:hypothetical protein
MWFFVFRNIMLLEQLEASSNNISIVQLLVKDLIVDCAAFFVGFGSILWIEQGFCGANSSLSSLLLCACCSGGFCS